MRDFFDDEERVKRLMDAAARWVGTPFAPNGNTCGARGGVSCQKLVEAIYHEVGFGCEVGVPAVRMGYARFARGESLVEKWIEGRPEFRLLENEWSRPGDLLGFRLGKVVHHLGIYVWKGEFVHAMDHIGTVISGLDDGTWGSRLVRVWRPII